MRSGIKARRGLKNFNPAPTVPSPALLFFDAEARAPPHARAPVHRPLRVVPSPTLLFFNADARALPHARALPTPSIAPRRSTTEAFRSTQTAAFPAPTVSAWLTAR